MLAVVTALKTWRHYLLGRFFDLYTDNESVSTFLKQPSLAPRQARWVRLLSEYDFNLYHLPGVRNVMADGLSCRPDHAQPAQDNLQIHTQCARSQRTEGNRLNIICATALRPITLQPLGNSLIQQIKEDAELDDEYQNVLRATKEARFN